MAMRTKGAALGTATNWIFNFMGRADCNRDAGAQLMQAIVVEVTPPGIENLQWRFYIIWTVFNFAFIPTGMLQIAAPKILSNFTVFFFYPETAGRTLEDIDRFFAGHCPLLVFKDKEAIAEKRPDRFVEHEKAEIRRNSSIVPQDVADANEAHNKERMDSGEYKENV